MARSDKQNGGGAVKSVISLVSLVAVLFLCAPDVFALATAQGVALDAANANCTDSADLNITFTSDANVTREYGRITNLAGDQLGYFEHATGFQNHSGTYVGYGQPIGPDQPSGSLIGTYAYVGNTPPDSATAEFFILYNCSTKQVLFSCYGQYGTCPQTAQEGQDRLNEVPTMSGWGMIFLAMILGSGSIYYLRRNQTA